MAFDISSWTRLEFEQTPIYIHPSRPDWFVPNDTGDRMLQALGRGEGIDGVVARRFLRRLPDTPAPAYTGRADLLKTDHLRELWLHVTDRCNLACSHCLFSSCSDASTEMPAATALALAEQAWQLGCRVFALTGGEPFVHGEIVPLIDGLLALDGANVVVLTNATLLNRHAARLKAWPRDRLHLQVSMDGLADRHDEVRGKGQFKKLSAQLGRLAEADIPCTLSMCVRRSNVGEMADAVAFAAEAGATNMHFMWYFVRGRADPSGRPETDALLAGLRSAAARGEQAGIGLDNLDALRGQVFAPPGTIHDGGGAGWESLAVGADGNVYPSAALVGVEALGHPVEGDLAGAWRQSPALERLRQTTAAGLDSPLRFILGGGDPDHCYVHGGKFVGCDPYASLHEKTALWLIAREAAALSDVAAAGEDDRPALRLKMGEILERCGAHGAVALTHSNCLLAVAGADGRTAVREFYTVAAEENQEDICNPVAYPPEVLGHIPPAARVRGYGCGSPVLESGILPGETVVDLGCGMGVECFIASRLAGVVGRVIGVDMLEPMLARARAGAAGVAANLGYDNLEFRQGYLERLPLDDASVDVALSNCVLNLSSHKRRTFAEIFRALRPGGRLVVSDVVCETEPPATISNDDVLRGQCVAGAMTQRDLFSLLAESGFVGARVVGRFPYRVVAGHRFFSLTFEARRPAPADRIRAMYRGPFAGVVTSDGTVLDAGRTVEVSRDQLAGCDGEMLEFDESGVATNVESGASCGCACDVPAAQEQAAAACCSPAPAAQEQAAPCRPSPADQDEPSADRAGSLLSLPVVEQAKHAGGCMVCKAPLVYRDVSAEAACYYCGGAFPADATCENGHFVCDGCHAADALSLIERVCLTTDETDMIALLRTIRSHEVVPLHGPEHHAMAPAIVLATYRNLGGQVPDAMIRTAILRGAKVPGGACAMMGACGAAQGVGVAFALILGSNPLAPGLRRLTMSFTRAALDRMTQYEAARCCQRECYLALQVAAELSAKYLPIQLKADADLQCEQIGRNTECLGPACPLYGG